MAFMWDFWRSSPPRLLGKKPAVPGAVSWRYRDVFDRSKLMRPPLVFGHIWNSTKIDMLGNNEAGNCVWATQAHLQQAMERGVRSYETVFSADSVLSDYSAATGYVKGYPKTDQGTMMADGASYWRKVGIADATGKRHRVEAYVDISFHDVDELVQATFDFGGIALGVRLPQSAMDQFDRGKPWTVVRGSKMLGGHAVALLGRNSAGDAIIATWDNITAASMQWVREYADEAVAFVSLAYLDARGVNPRGYDRVELEKRLAELA